MATSRAAYYRQYRSIRRDSFKKWKLTRKYLSIFHPQNLKDAENYAAEELLKTVKKETKVNVKTNSPVPVDIPATAEHAFDKISGLMFKPVCITS